MKNSSIFYDFHDFMNNEDFKTLSIQERKLVLRKKIKNSREFLQDLKDLPKSEQIKIQKDYREKIKKICNSNFFCCADVVLSYSALKTEVNPQEISKFALQQKKILALPKISLNENGKMDFFIIENEKILLEKLENEKFGIKTAPQNAKKFDFENSSQKILVLVPCLALTQSGKRLGRGGGYYDRFLLRLKNAACDFTTLGLCRKTQKLPAKNFPFCTHDFPLDFCAFL